MAASRPVLVIDDDDSIRELVQMALRDEGYDVLTAQHGGAALSLLGREDPGLILLDMRMPVMDGWEFIALLRSRASLAGIPVGVQTAEVDRTLPGGVSFVLGKPIDLDALLTLVRHHCGG